MGPPIPKLKSQTLLISSTLFKLSARSSSSRLFDCHAPSFHAPKNDPWNSLPPSRGMMLTLTPPGETSAPGACRLVGHLLDERC